MPELSVPQTVLVFAVVASAACVQGSIGFGLGLVAAPLLALVDPAFVPGPLMLNATLLTTLLLVRERRSVDLRGVGWALLGCTAGSAGAAFALLAVDARGFSLLFAGLVLAAVGLSATGRHPRVSPRNALLAGAASGFMGTTSAIGGPPMALLYQRAEGARLRGTLAAYFLVSTALGILALAVAGRFGPPELGRALLLLPGLLSGFGISFWTARRLQVDVLRPLVLSVAAASALLVLLRALT